MLEILGRKGHVFLVEMAIHATLVVLFDFLRNFTFMQSVTRDYSNGPSYQE